MEGDEHAIRWFTFLFLAYSFQQIKWPFSLITQQAILQQADPAILDLSETQQSFYCYLFAIWTLRREQGVLPPLPPDQQTVLAHLCEENNVSYGLLSPHSTSERARHEYEFFNLYIRIFISDSLPVSVKQKIATILDQQKEQYPYLQEMAQLVHHFETFFQLQLKKSTKQFFFYFLTIHFLLLQTISGRTNPFFRIASNFEDLSLQTDDIHTRRVHRFLEDLRQHYPNWEKKYHLAPHVLYIQDVFYTLYKMTYKPSIRVFVQFTKNLMGRNFLMAELHALFQPELIQFVHHVNQADLIISDTPEHQPGALYFFMDHIFAIDQWRALLSLIQDQLLQQTFFPQKED